jgi:hypothetical protein
MSNGIIRLESPPFAQTEFVLTQLHQRVELLVAEWPAIQREANLPGKRTDPAERVAPFVMGRYRTD